jgi:hypothetical protein
MMAHIKCFIDWFPVCSCYIWSIRLLVLGSNSWWFWIYDSETDSWISMIVIVMWCVIEYNGIRTPYKSSCKPSIYFSICWICKSISECWNIAILILFMSKVFSVDKEFSWFGLHYIWRTISIC